MARTWYGGALQETLRRHWVGDRWQLVSYFVDGLSRWSWMYITGTIAFATVGTRRVLEYRPSVSNSAAISWSGGGARVDVEVIAKVRQFTGTTARSHGIACRLGGTSTDNQGYILRLSGGNSLDVRKFFGDNLNNLVSSYTGLTQSVTFNQSIGSWYWLRLRVVGSDILGKAWADGQPEPANWMVGGRDSAYTAAGSVGFFVGSGIDTFQADQVAVIPTVPA